MQELVFTLSTFDCCFAVFLLSGAFGFGCLGIFEDEIVKSVSVNIPGLNASLGMERQLERMASSSHRCGWIERKGAAQIDLLGCKTF